MKKFFMKLTAIAVMPMLLAACTKDEVNPTPVSYTHLTLPTILRV